MGDVIESSKDTFRQTAKSIFWVDLIRAVAIVLVIVLHAAAPAVFQYGKTPIDNWWVSNLFDSSTRMSVPLFFMISGYLLLSKQEEIRRFFVKRFRKVFFPFVAWSAIYMVFDSLYMGHEYTLSKVVASFLEGPVYVHLWFLYALINIYLFVPVLRVFTKNLSREHAYYFVSLWFLAAAIIPLLKDLTNINIAINLPMFSGFSGYFILGWLVGNTKFSKRSITWLFCLFLLSVFFTCYATFVISEMKSAMNEYFYTYLSPNVIVMALTIFAVLKYVGESTTMSAVLRKGVKLVSDHSFGIYLIHIAILQFMTDSVFGYRVDGLLYPALFSIPATAIVAFVLSLSSIMILKKIRIIRALVP